jgi:hypothetical protein
MLDIQKGAKPQNSKCIIEDATTSHELELTL